MFDKEYKKKSQYVIQYVNDEGKNILFTQTKETQIENYSDNENTKYSKVMIGDFEVLVGEDSKY